MNIPLDIYRFIVSMFDYDTIMIYKQVNKQANEIVHQVHKIIYATNNIYDACRNNNIVSFKHLLPTSKGAVPFAIQLTTSIDILFHARNVMKDDPTSTGVINYIHAAMLRNNILALPPAEQMIPELIELFVCKRNHVMLRLLPSINTLVGNPVNIYAATGQYDHVVQYIEHLHMKASFACAAYVSRDQRIIDLADRKSYNNVLNMRDEIHLPHNIYTPYILCSFAIIANNIDVFIETMPYAREYSLTLLESIIYYNRVDFVRRTNITEHLVFTSFHEQSMTRMTREMAIALVECMREHGTIDMAFKLVIRARNYELIQLINTYYSARVDLTRKSTHEDYIQACSS